MNILHVVNIAFVIPYILGEQLCWFAGRGYQEYIICSPSDELEKLSRQYGFQYKPIEVLRKISIGKDLRTIYRTLRYIRQIKADVVTGHTPKGGLIAMLAAYMARVPVRIYFRHGLVYETSTGIKRCLLASADRLTAHLATKVVCVSPSVARRSIEDGLNPGHKQIVLANGTCNGIDIKRFCRENIDTARLTEIRQKSGVNDNDFVIGFTGRLVRDKGIIELVKAYIGLRKQHKNLKLLLVGIFEVKDALPSEMVKTIREDQGIICTGYVEHSAIELYYALMDVFVLPSYREGLPTSILEASAMEIPVITTRATGCCDAIIGDETGMFVNHDHKELEKTILRLYEDAMLRSRIGKAGRQFVAGNFEQHIVWREIEKLYIPAG